MLKYAPQLTSGRFLYYLIPLIFITGWTPFVFSQNLSNPAPAITEKRENDTRLLANVTLEKTDLLISSFIFDNGWQPTFQPTSNSLERGGIKWFADGVVQVTFFLTPVSNGVQLRATIMGPSHSREFKDQAFINYAFKRLWQSLGDYRFMGDLGVELTTPE